MKESKPLTPHADTAALRRDDAHGTGERSVGLSLVRSQPRLSRGRLDRQTLNKLGKALDAYFNSLCASEVPERFRRLLDDYDERRSIVLRGTGGAKNEGHS
jgi:hypothetical protein